MIRLCGIYSGRSRDTLTGGKKMEYLKQHPTRKAENDPTPQRELVLLMTGHLVGITQADNSVSSNVSK